MATTFKILAGTSRNFTSIWADPTANINTAKMYIGSVGSGAAFSVADLTTNTLSDSYLIDKKGDFNETLDSEDIIDINVNTAGE